MKGMILAAGYGTRLWPLTIDRTKPAIPVMGRPLVGYVAEYLARFGIREVLVNLHHQPDSVRDALGDGSRFGVRLRYIYEPEILGTGGALDNAREFLEDEPFVVINGKIVTDIDLHAACATHRERGALATLVLRPNPARERFSQVLVENGLLQGFGGMPDASDNAGRKVKAAKDETGKTATAPKATHTDVITVPDTADRDGEQSVPLMFTGLQILQPDIFRYIPRGRFSHTTTDVYPFALSQGEIIAGHVAAGYWYELSTLSRYLATSCALLDESGANASLSQGAYIASGAVVKHAVLWEDARIESGARVTEAIIGAGVTIKGDMSLERVAVVRAELVRGQAKPEKAAGGYFQGDCFVVPLS